MNAIVCLKEVPDTETRIEVRDGKVAEEGIQYVVNPYDEFALEEALKWQEEYGGKVTLPDGQIRLPGDDLRPHQRGRQPGRHDRHIGHDDQEQEHDHDPR